jgi:threonine synthase
VRALPRFVGVLALASEAELANAAGRADLAGMFCCPHTGVALAALEKLIARGEIRREHRTVVVSTANALKFTDFKIRYHEDALEGVPDPRHRNVPVPLPNQYQAVREAVLRDLEVQHGAKTVAT